MDVGSPCGRLARQEKMIRKLKKKVEDTNFKLKDALRTKEAAESRLEVYKTAASSVPKLKEDLQNVTTSLEESEMIRRRQKQQIVELKAELMAQTNPSPKTTANSKTTPNKRVSRAEQRKPVTGATRRKRPASTGPSLRTSTGIASRVGGRPALAREALHRQEVNRLGDQHRKLKYEHAATRKSAAGTLRQKN